MTNVTGNMDTGIYLSTQNSEQGTSVKSVSNCMQYVPIYEASSGKHRGPDTSRMLKMATEIVEIIIFFEGMLIFVQAKKHSEIHICNRSRHTNVNNIER